MLAPRAASTWMRGSGFRPVFKALLILNLIVPYVLWKFYIEPKIVEIEFKSTFRFAVVITLVPIYLILIVFLSNYLVGIIPAMLYLLGVFILAKLAIKL